MNSAIEKPLSPKMGFGYRGFGCTSITAVISKHEITQPIAAVNQINHPKEFNISTKMPTGKSNVIQPLPGTKKNLEDLKPKPFRAKPVPLNHYKEPFRPELPSQKYRQRALKEGSHPGLVSRILKPNKPDDEEMAVEPVTKHDITRPIAAVNRINHPKEFNISTKVPTGKSNVIQPLPGTKKNLEDLKPKPFRARPVPRHHSKEPFRPELPSQKGRQSAPKEETNPGLVSRILHSIVDPILKPNKPEDEEMTVEPAKEEVNSTESDLTVSETDEPPATITEPEVKGVDEQPEGESDGVEDSDDPDVTSTIVSILQSYQEPEMITPIQTLNEPYAFLNSRSDTVDIPDEVEKGEQELPESVS
ncbi:hypothetical protein DAPPUDRAFT_120000 [Daphnia pulex]|uniref:Uncharacterized protein n=1 Tax=Daphnia pulex TaxID=6669 RepID=E9I013_DAPPU|nr:hypothetical protein DAPPUDRAFT_120000 [Daphnia pulex]|eukprot:EFX62667.1 hypothetical protein DAPPUDRAFT_120000 [Daphnia pulex]